jgi:Ca2+-binding EF-hand superfamily protein
MGTTEEYITSLIQAVDKNKDGIMCFEEFARIYKKLEEEA